MIVREVEGVDRIGIGGRSRDIRVEEGRGVGPCRPDGGTVSVHGVPGDAATGWRPGAGEVTKAANTSSPAPTTPVAPVSTALPSGARAVTIWSSEPARATPEYSATVPCR